MPSAQSCQSVDRSEKSHSWAAELLHFCRRERAEEIVMGPRETHCRRPNLSGLAAATALSCYDDDRVRVSVSGHSMRFLHST